MDGTRIGDKPGLETCVVSQVVADSLARVLLEGCQGTRRVHGGNMYEEVHPCRVNIIYSNSRVHGKGLLGCLYQFIDK